MPQDGRLILFEAIGHKQWPTVSCQHLGHLMHDALRHRQGTAADIDHHQQLARGVHGRPHPVAGALQTLDGLVVVDRTRFAVS